MLFPVILALTNVVSASPLHNSFRRQNSIWSVDNFESLITFGDSYTDENRLSYFIQNNGSAPPPGTYFPEGLDTASGGRTWPRFVVQSRPRMTLYNYAVSGAVCSNNITPRTLDAINDLFPAVLEYEVPAFLADRNTTRNGTDQTYFSTALAANNAVYSLWIGTNDLGQGLFLTGGQIHGLTLSDYAECIFRVFDELYASGGRVFVLFNNAPLHLSPLYANDSLNGVVDSPYWNKTDLNRTDVAERMHEYVTSTNTIFRYQSPFELLVAERYPGANFAIFNVYQLMSDMYHNPASYFNGSEPANVTGWENQCSAEQECQLAYDGTSSDSFMWFDELHPSEQTDRIIAESFVEVLNGSSSYAQYHGA